MNSIPESSSGIGSASRNGEQSERYVSVRRVTQMLAAPLSAEDCAIQSMPDASPVKWHLAHTTWFFETFVLEPNRRAYQTFRRLFRVPFNSCYNGVGEKHPRPERGLLSRPGLDEVLHYRQHADKAMIALLARERLPSEVAGLIELKLLLDMEFLRRLSAMSGNGPAATTVLIPVSARRMGRLVSTTTSSCPANTYCAVVRALRRCLHKIHLPEIFPS